MTDIENLASEFRKTLIPTVAKKIPWKAMTPESQQTYVEAAGSAVLFMLSALRDTARAETRDLEEENAALRRALAEKGLEPIATATGEFYLAETPKDE